ncbi:MAG: hypothetical protein ACEPOZ_10540 [Marinifilaceae bacterium]
MMYVDAVYNEILKKLKKDVGVAFFHTIDFELRKIGYKGVFNRRDSYYYRNNKNENVDLLWVQAFALLRLFYEKKISLVSKIYNSLDKKLSFCISSYLDESLKESHVTIKKEKQVVFITHKVAKKDLVETEYLGVTNGDVKQEGSFRDYVDFINESLKELSNVNQKSVQETLNRSCIKSKTETLKKSIDTIGINGMDEVVEAMLIFNHPTMKFKSKKYVILTTPSFEVDGYEETSGGIAGFIDYDFNTYIEKYHSIIGEWCNLSTTRELSRALKERATKSAISAIMSRNGSHNIGSHVLSSTDHSIMDPTDMQVLMQYIQQRWDFLAQVTTDWPRWTSSLKFHGQIMRNFYEQRLLLNKIVKSEGLSAFEYGQNESKEGKLQIEIKSLVPKDRTVKKSEWNTYTGKWEEVDVHEENRNGHQVLIDDVDFALAIPGGITGSHAFYTVLENIIRNTAKHAYQRKADFKEGLKIVIQYKELDDRVEFFIYDELSKANRELKLKKDENEDHKLLITNLETKLNEAFLHEDGRLRQEGWGLAELRIAATYLNRADTHRAGEEWQESVELSKINEKIADAGFPLIYVMSRDEKEALDKEVLKKEGLDFGKIKKEKRNKDYQHKNKGIGYFFSIPKPIQALYAVENNDGGCYNKIDKQLNRGFKEAPITCFFDNKEEIEKFYKEKDISYRYVHYSLSELDKYFQVEKNKETTTKDDAEQDKFDQASESNLGKSNSGPKDEDSLKINNEIEQPSNGPNKEVPLLDTIKQKWLTTILTRNENIRKGKIEVNEDGVIELLLHIDTSDEVVGTQELNDELIWEYFLEKFGRDFTEVAGMRSNEHDERILSGFLNKASLSNLNNLPFDTFSRNVGEQYRDVYERIMMLKNTIKRNYTKYNEDIETLPKYYRLSRADEDQYAKGGKHKQENIVFENYYDKGRDIFFEEPDAKNNDVKKYKVKIKWASYQEVLDQPERSIVLKRHYNSTSKFMYAEALSGAQSYFNELHAAAKKGKIPDEMIYDIVETALLNVAIVDERFEEFMNKTDSQTRQRIEGAKVKSVPKEFFFEVTNRDQLIKQFEEAQVVVVHLAMLEKLAYNVYGNEKEQLGLKLLEQLKDRKKFVFITTGKGKTEEVYSDYRVVPFADVQRTVMKAYPEKKLLIQTLMNITPSKSNKK